MYTYIYTGFGARNRVDLDWSVALSIAFSAQPDSPADWQYCLPESTSARDARREHIDCPPNR